MEQQRTLELNLISAKDLKNLSFFSKMDVYAVVSITGDSSNLNQKVKTPIDREGGTNPVWNFPIKLTFNETLARQNRLTLEVHLRCDSSLADDTDLPADNEVGRIHVPLAELLNQSSGNERKPFQNVTHQVRRPSGEHKGSLNFSYKFGDEVATANPVNAPPHNAEPVVAHPPPVTGSCSKSCTTAYPPRLPQHSGYGYLPQHSGYGHPPQHGGYGHPPRHHGRYGHLLPHGGYGHPPAQHSGYGHLLPHGGYGPLPLHHGGYGHPPPQHGGYGHLLPHGAYWHPPPHHGGYGHPLLQQGELLSGLLIGDMVSDSGPLMGDMVSDSGLLTGDMVTDSGLLNGDMVSESFDDTMDLINFVFYFRLPPNLSPSLSRVKL